VFGIQLGQELQIQNETIACETIKKCFVLLCAKAYIFATRQMLFIECWFSQIYCIYM